MSNIHRGSCSSLAVSRDGKYLATAGDRLVKMWDYHMRLDINFQVFTVYLLSSNADIRLNYCTSCSNFLCSDIVVDMVGL